MIIYLFTFYTMKKTISFYDFCDAFPESRKDTFSYEGKKAIFEYIEELEDETGEETELDVIALCCEFTEYENMEEFWGVYDKEKYETFEDIEDCTIVIYIGKYQDPESPFIIADF